LGRANSEKALAEFDQAAMFAAYARSYGQWGSVKFLYHHRIHSRDGQSVHLEELVAALRSIGHDVVLIGPEGFARASFGHDPKLIGALKRLMPRVLYEALELGYNLPAYLRLRTAWGKIHPDVIYERYNLYLLAGAWLRRRKGKRAPLLLEVNAPLAQERAMYGGLGLKALARRLEAWTWRSADFVMPVTAVLAEQVRAAGVPPERIVVIPNGIDPARFAGAVTAETAKTALGLTGKTVLGFTGFMRDWHGLDTILDWMGKPDADPTLHLVLAGDGPALPALKAQAARLGITDRVRFAGLVDRDTVARMVASFDIALQPKSVAYASPLKLFEYMALGKAIVAPDQANIREVVEHNVTALLFDPATPQRMIAAIDTLAGDRALRGRLGSAARDAITARDYTWKGNARRVAELAGRITS
jgi:glycosyltransferase involved in cell wall biosynthesis